MRSRKFYRARFAELQRAVLHQLQLNRLVATPALRQAFALNHRSIQSVSPATTRAAPDAEARYQ